MIGGSRGQVLGDGMVDYGGEIGWMRENEMAPCVRQWGFDAGRTHWMIGSSRMLMDEVGRGVSGGWLGGERGGKLECYVNNNAYGT